MQASQIRKFNTVCIALSAVFLIGTIFTIQDASFGQTQDRIHTTQYGQGIQQYSNIAIEQLNRPLGDDPQGHNVIIEQSNNEAGENEQGTANKEQEQKKVSFPAAVNLPVPFTSQAPDGNWDQPWQDACEEAAVLMLDAYYKKYGLSKLFAKDEIIKMVSWEEQNGWGRSIEIEKIKALFEWYNGKQLIMNKEQTTIVKNPTIDDIKKSVAAGHPVLVVAYGKELPNPNFRNGGPEYHALIVRGYTEDGFITNDPGTRKGENFVYKYDDLMNAIRDWNHGDVKNGKRAVLMMK